MPLIHEPHDSLPYIDADLSPSSRAAISALVAAELSASSSDTTTLHPLIPQQPQSSFSPVIEQELQRLAQGQPRDPSSGIDLSRYEAPSAPSSSSASDWKSALQTAYAASSYLSSRQQNLSLLETFGKNAWLVHNAQLSDELAALERELAATQTRVQEIETQRREAQRAVAGELAVLEEGWRRGVGRAIEVSVAAEGVRRKVLERRRERAT
ncbi:hypothetical protein B0A49_10494 [Cryomyces minteri]|uniref:Breast carcinoma amplified sequence 2 n=1 Tax=Cryomyces minteri TaxID=331657 RepID=A0A4U0WG47_9PEZI|nr:hypothetical protein B0A49_10494 [Cryomyces minteri]